jgi:tetratricopeptide (TPR) repeat protein
MLELYQGRYANARKHLEEALLLNVAAKSALTEARNHLYLSLVFEGTRNDAALLAELDKAVANLKGLPPQVWLASRMGVGYARAGAVGKARALLDVIRAQAETQIAQQSADVHRLEGELQLAQGDRAAAIDTLLLADREAQAPLTTESLARAYRISGDVPAAVAQYERLVSWDEGTIGWEPQQEWLASHYHLATLYQGQGQKEKAKPLVQRLLGLWKDADPDLPLLKDVRRLNTELGG